jgi:hypothetical protein
VTEWAPGLVWATRGFQWGYRLLLTAGLDDPLQHYEEAFDGAVDEPSMYQRNAAGVALRFPDPDGRKDAAGRVIPHEFVLLGSLADKVQTVDDGVELIWPLVAPAYARVWDAPHPPTTDVLET